LEKRQSPSQLLPTEKKTVQFSKSTKNNSKAQKRDYELTVFQSGTGRLLSHCLLRPDADCRPV